MTSGKENNQKGKDRKANVFAAFFAYFCILAASVFIIVRVSYLQLVKSSDLREEQEKELFTYGKLEATRGDILARDGSLLATTIPIYEIRMDTRPTNNPNDTTPLISDKKFYRSVDSLAYSLSALFKNRTSDEYKRMLVKGRKENNRYLLIKRNVSYRQLKELQEFAIFKEEKKKGGLIYIKQNKREMPYGSLAKRTIGFRTDSIFVGIEGGFNDYLSGQDGSVLKKKVASNVWIPIDSENNTDPIDGKDVLTTINIVIQDIANQSLLVNIDSSKAESGCVVVMEVATGDILAIVNLKKTNENTYSEVYNTAINYAFEPGSTFKAVSFMVALEDKKVRLTDRIHIESNKLITKYRTIYDSDDMASKEPTVKEIFEKSSNIGTYKIISENYESNPQQYIDGIYKIGIQNSLGLPFLGESAPYIKNTQNKTWSKTSLGSMSYGYEVLLTPLQMLTFYNAIANNGVMVKPRFVKAILENGQIAASFDTEIINPKICSDATIQQMQTLLRGVVTNGTGKTGFAGTAYAAAGKTGTAYIAQDGNYDEKIYNASFCGYFPAENPKYSCIILIHKLKGRKHYAAQVAIPVFRDIAEKIYATNVELMAEANSDLSDDQFVLSSIQACSNRKNLQTIFDFIGFNLKTNPGSEWISVDVAQKNAKTSVRNIHPHIVPNVQGMNLSDAIFLMEKVGISVKTAGIGNVVSQSIPAGEMAKKGSSVYLQLAKNK